MDLEELKRLATPEQVAGGPDRYRDRLPQLHGTHEHDAGSVREVTYKGHEIRIVTRYEITLDGRPIKGHMLVSNAGTVHYHGIPNQDFTSAIDVVKRLVDLSGARLDTDSPNANGDHDGHGEHPHGNGGH
ncbi:MAG: hypothetical protein ACRDZ4_09690 [Egibacteraceae bacterium]